MANLDRVMFDASLVAGNSTVVRVSGSDAILSGSMIPVFFPDTQAGAVGYVIVDSTGKRTSFAEGVDLDTAEGVSVRLSDTNPPANGQGYATVSASGAVGIRQLIRVITLNPDNSDVGIRNRVAALEASSGGSVVPPNAAIADIVNTSIAAASKPTGSADVAALEAKLGAIIDALNVNRSVTMDLRTKFNLALKALEDHGIILP